MRLINFLTIILLLVSCQSKQSEPPPPVFTATTEELVSGEVAEWADCIAYDKIISIPPYFSLTYKFEYSEEFMRTASPEDLLKLTNHLSPEVRIYAFNGLVNISHIETYSAFNELRNDVAEVRYHSGCILDSKTVGEFVFEIIQTGHALRSCYLPQPKEAYQLDSIAAHCNKEYTQLPVYNPWLELYPTIRERVLQNEAYHLSPTLAAYQKVQDIDFILSLFEPQQSGFSEYNTAIAAAFEFPHPAFIPPLKTLQLKSFSPDKYLDNLDLTNLYLTIFQYPPDTIIEFMEAIPNNSADPYIKDSHLAEAEIARRLNRNPAKKSLLEKQDLDEWHQMILSHLQEYRKYENLY